MKLIRTLLLTAILSVGMLAPVILISSPIQAQEIKSNLCDGAELTFTSANAECTKGTVNAAGKCVIGGSEVSSTQCPESGLNKLIANIVNILSVIVGIIAVIMIIIGGFKYITSSGDASNVTSAKNTVLYAVVGLIIVALAQIIVRFVLSKVGTNN